MKNRKDEFIWTINKILKLIFSFVYRHTVTELLVGENHTQLILQSQLKI